MGARRRLPRAVPALPMLSALALTAVLANPAAQAQSDPAAAAEAELSRAQAELARAYEAFTAAQQRQEATAKEATAAQTTAQRTRTEATAAAAQVGDARGQFDRFTAASFRQGSTVGSVTAYLGAANPHEMLERASLLNAVSGEHVDVLDTMRQAVDTKTERDRAAQDAVRTAAANRDAAAKAKTDAERAYKAAVAKQDSAKEEIDRLAARARELAAQAAPAAPAPSAPASSSASVVRPAQGQLTSTYGARWGTVHYGIDIANSIGTPILAAMAGDVIDSGPASGFGLWVRLQHDDGTITVYGHINESLVSVGQHVSAGQQIATMGNRGQSTGPHLHFEVHENGSKIDPLPWLRSRGVSI
ncbi:M23 family metallopeptidase [Saccharomonospora sp. NPDC046836]|uniref:M23 family metallopeptidase n=1 Tax=Saccharomonospora sp. NPDC046836 TaxID=3156921 RepID=UPI0034026C2C